MVRFTIYRARGDVIHPEFLGLALYGTHILSIEYLRRRWNNAFQIEYKGKGYFSGRSHSFKAVLTPPGSSTAAKKYEGVWHETSKDLDTGETFTDVTTPKEEVTVGPLENMHDFESRKLWQHVARGIREGDYDAASREKSKIEVRLSASDPLTLLYADRGTTTERAAATSAGRTGSRRLMAAVALRTHPVGPCVRAPREEVQRQPTH